MSTGNSRKRPTEQDTPTSAPKRAATRKEADVEVIDVEVEEEEADFQIEAELHPKFKVFPDHLRKILQDLYKGTIRFQMTALMTNTVPRHKYTYSVVTEHSVRQSPNGPNRTIVKANIPSLSLCNTALLNIFLKSRKDTIVPKNKFVRLDTISGMTNPGFTQLHSVRHGETGWGFDCNGCLSLHLPFIEHNRKNEYYIYVERTELKVEPKDEI